MVSEAAGPKIRQFPGVSTFVRRFVPPRQHVSRSIDAVVKWHARALVGHGRPDPGADVKAWLPGRIALQETLAHCLRVGVKHGLGETRCSLGSAI